MPNSRFSASGQSRMTANPAKPIGRYRPGKAVVEEASDSEEEELEEQQIPQEQSEALRPKATSFPAGRAPATSKTRAAPVEEDSDEEGFVTEEEDEGVAVGQPSSRSAPVKSEDGIQKGLTKPELEESEEEESEEEDEEDESEEEESSSEEEAPQRKFLRPTFIKKSDRNGKTASPLPAENDTAKPQPITASTPGAPRRSHDGLTEEEVRRRELADLMITDKLERDAIARAAGKKSWDDDDEVAPEDMVDDTDDLDPEAELAAWKLRELKRLKRDREAIEAREKEIEEIERRRNLTAEEREKEDAEYLAAQKEERESGKGKAGFLQRYHHKGAFFQDDETSREILARRDLMGAKYVDQVQNREALPEYMQIRDMSKLGRKGRTRYKDLRTEDTGRWADYGRPGPKTPFSVDDERFRPDSDRKGVQNGPTGANAGALGPRRVDGAVPKGPKAFRERESGGGDSYRPTHRDSHCDDDDDDDDWEVRDRRRSRSPPRRKRYSYSSGEEDSHTRRKRSPSPYRERDKRRKVHE